VDSDLAFVDFDLIYFFHGYLLEILLPNKVASVTLFGEAIINFYLSNQIPCPT
jgi:hypothetical protein